MSRFADWTEQQHKELTYIATHASYAHGLSAHISHQDHSPYTSRECASYGDVSPTTAAVLRFMVDHGYLEIRSRTVDLDKAPGKALGDWAAMKPTGVVTLRTWHLTEAGREAWVGNDW